MRLFSLSLRYAFAFLASTAIVFSNTYVFAAEQVVLKYRIFRQSLSVRELTTFAQTGELSSSLRVNLALARQEPQKIRQYLTATVKAEPILLDRVLNSPIGEVLLDEISKTIYTPSRQADRQALRAAIVLSAGDRQLSLLEILQNYPTTVVEVDGDRLESAYNQLRRLQGTLENIL
jgi:Alpha/beta hydrolase of unknown function (DUF1400)